MQHIYGISTIKELQNFDPTTSTHLHVAGYFSEGDGGGGHFFWQPDETTDPDNGLVFRSHVQPRGRWRRILSSGQDVRFFGAFTSSGDVSTQFQKALDACNKGGRLYIPSGNYTISRPLEVHQGTSVIGDGLLSEIHYHGPTGTACWNAAQRSPATSMSFRGLNTLVHKNNTYAFRLTGMSYSRFDTLFVHLRASTPQHIMDPLMVNPLITTFLLIVTRRVRVASPTVASVLTGLHMTMAIWRPTPIRYSVAILTASTLP